MIACRWLVWLAASCAAATVAVAGDPWTDFVGRQPPNFKIPAKAMFNHDGEFELTKQQGKVVWLEFTFAH